MPIQGGIGIGDAVLSVLIDLTELDTLEARLATRLPTAMRPATDGISKLGAAFETAEASANQAAEGATKAATQITAAGKAGATAGANIAAGGKQAAAAFIPAAASVDQVTVRTKELEAETVRLREQVAAVGTQFTKTGETAAFSMREAKGEIALLGEATGVTLPRHVRSFVAELPGVGVALEAAFSATAIFFIADALIKAGEKLGEWTADTFIFTEAMKKANEELKTQNDEILALVKSTKQLRDERELAAAKNPVERDSILLRQQARDVGTVEDAQKKLNDSLERAAKLRAAINALPVDAEWAATQERFQKSLDEVNARIPLEKANLDNLTQSHAKLVEELGRDESDKAVQAASQLAKQQLDAQIAGINLFKAQQELAFASGEISAGQWSAAQIQAADKARSAQEDYGNTIITIATRFKDNAGAQAAAQEAATNKTNLTKQAVDALAKSLEELRAQEDKFDELTKKLATPENVDVAPDASAFNPWQKALDNITAAYQTLGIDGVIPLTAALADQKAALDAIAQGFSIGAASQDDYNRAQIKVLTTEIALGKALGNDVTNLVKMRQELVRQLPDQKKYGQTAEQVARQIGSAITATAFAYGQSGITIVQVLRQIAAATIQAIASIAEKKGVEQLALAFGSWPDAAAMAAHFGAAALWFSLAGAISAVGGATAGSGQSSSSGESGAGQGVGAISTSPVGTIDATPVGVTNTQRLGISQVQPLLTRGTAVVGGNSIQASNSLAAQQSRTSASVDALSSQVSGVSDRLDQQPTVHNHITVQVDGMISSDNLKKVVKDISRQVNRGAVPLKASSSFRVTKRG